MSIVQRVEALGLPLDQIVVIGSGVLDALHLRGSDDIDLAVSRDLFEQLKQTDEYNCLVKHGEEVLEKNDMEIWLDWGEADDLSFEALYDGGVTVGTVRFCHPDIVIEQKRLRGLPKDIRDIQLLETYLAGKSR